MQPPDELTDDALVRAARGGDERAFELLFERHRPRVARIAARFFPAREAVEEIVQESFTKAFLALEDYAGRHQASFAAWLSQIAVNACYDELRRLRRRPRRHDDDISEADTGALGAALAAAGDIEAAVVSRDLARKLLARLDAEDQLVLTLLDAEGLSVAEIAGLTGWSASKVKVRAHRARAHLRRVLKKYL